MNSWKGRFRAPLDPRALRFSSSLGVDRRLYQEDIDGSLAHLEMLAKQKILSDGDARKLRRALLEIRKEIASGKMRLTVPEGVHDRFVAEDVHMAIENRLLEKVGERGGMLHTARSRNDQIALDERLYLRKVIQEIARRIVGVQRTLIAKAEEYGTIIMPGYTHLQRAQPVLLAHHLLAYVAMLDRDRERYLDCLKRAATSPLGAGALAGTSFPIDRHRVAQRLGLHGVVENSIDAVSDRDTLIEFISASAMTMMHLSRLGEELVLWSSQEWRFVEVGDAFSTGSSIMPQKKNPDMAELIRGKTGRVYGDLMALLTVMKGLPLAYNRDMQEDKEPLFDAADTVLDSLEIAAPMIRSLTFFRDRFDAELGTDFLLATELADYLVRHGLPFRQAHGIVGKLVALCVDRGLSLSQLPLNEYRRLSPLFGKDVGGLLDARVSVTRKRSAGSTAPQEVKRSLARWKKKLGRG